jgi:predicted lactoylglutathione lyase
MTKMIFVNLPVANLPESISFYEAIGFKNNPAFSDETAACMVWSDAINVMLLTHDKWRTFTDRDIPPTSTSEVMLAISLEDKDTVDTLTEAAQNAGGTGDINPKQDLGFMYSRSLTDLDGHVWELMWMDLAAFSQEG